MKRAIELLHSREPFLQFLDLRGLSVESTGMHTLNCGVRIRLSVAEGDPYDADFGFGNTYHLTVRDE